MKKLIYSFALLVFAFGCSKNDDNDSDEPCILYRVFISDDCNCNDMDFNCGDLKFISEDEFARLKNIQETSTESCIYIQSEEHSNGVYFEGYMIALDQNACDFDININ